MPKKRVWKNLTLLGINGTNASGFSVSIGEINNIYDTMKIKQIVISNRQTVGNVNSSTLSLFCPEFFESFGGGLTGNSTNPNIEINISQKPLPTVWTILPRLSSSAVYSVAETFLIQIELSGSVDS